MASDPMRALKQHKRDWDDLAGLDPFWGVLAHPDRKHGAWDPEVFFKTGVEDVATLLGHVRSLGEPQAHGAALDFGCGLGRLTVPLAESFDKCVGVDISEQMIRLARWYHRGVTKVRFKRIERDLGMFPTESFDLVLSLLVLQHQPSREAVSAWLKELVRVLKPGGILIFQLPCRLGFRSRWQLRRKAYRFFRGLRVPRGVLYCMGLHPIRMLAIPEAQVRQTLETLGCVIRGVLLDGSAGSGNESRLYIVTR